MADNQAVTFATWGVNPLNIRLQQVLDWLEANPVDVLALQELQLAQDKYPVDALNEAAWQARWQLTVRWCSWLMTTSRWMLAMCGTPPH